MEHFDTHMEEFGELVRKLHRVLHTYKVKTGEFWGHIIQISNIIVTKHPSTKERMV